MHGFQVMLFAALQVMPGSSWLSTLGFTLPSISFKHLLRRVFFAFAAAILVWTSLHRRQQDNKTLRFASSVRIRFSLETVAHCHTTGLMHLEARCFLERSSGAHEMSLAGKVGLLQGDPSSWARIRRGRGPPAARTAVSQAPDPGGYGPHLQSSLLRR